MSEEVLCKRHHPMYFGAIRLDSLLAGFQLRAIVPAHDSTDAHSITAR